MAMNPTQRKYKWPTGDSGTVLPNKHPQLLLFDTVNFKIGSTDLRVIPLSKSVIGGKVYRESGLNKMAMHRYLNAIFKFEIWPDPIRRI